MHTVEWGDKLLLSRPLNLARPMHLVWVALRLPRHRLIPSATTPVKEQLSQRLNLAHPILSAWVVLRLPLRLPLEMLPVQLV